MINNNTPEAYYGGMVALVASLLSSPFVACYVFIRWNFLESAILDSVSTFAHSNNCSTGVDWRSSSEEPRSELFRLGPLLENRKVFYEFIIGHIKITIKPYYCYHGYITLCAASGANDLRKSQETTTRTEMEGKYRENAEKGAEYFL